MGEGWARLAPFRLLCIHHLLIPEELRGTSVSVCFYGWFRSCVPLCLLV